MQVLLHAAIRVVDPAVEHELRRPILELVDRDLLQQRHRIVIELAPQHRIQLTKETGGFRIPAPPEVLRERAQPLVRRRDELAERSRFGHDRRELGPRHDHHSNRVDAEQPRLDGLNDEHALEHAAIDDRHAQERPIRIFARFPEVLEPRMQRRVRDDLRPQLLGHEAGEALGEPHPDAADALRAQTDCRGQHQVGAIRLQQIDGADIGLEPRPNQMDDVGQRLGGVAALARSDD